MPCRHKFYDDLSLSRINFQPNTLIVGTFNPAWPEENYAEWFYGRTGNNYFWDLLPRMYGDMGLRNAVHKDWKRYCRQKQIALTDLIENIEDADLKNAAHVSILGEHTDSAIAGKFKQQISNPIISILQAHPSIEHVYLTTTNSSRFWQNLWAPIHQYCITHGLRCNKLMTPSKGPDFS